MRDDGEMTIRLRVLGGVSLDAGGERLTEVLSGAKRTALLVYLAMADADRGVERDDVLSRFWPESNDARARQSFRQSLHVLRKELGPDVITTEGNRVRLTPGLLSCDAIAFRTAASQGDHELALEMYAGELLPGFHVSGLPDLEEWIDSERRTLARTAARSAWMLVEAAEARGDSTGAAYWARKAVQLTPFHESGVQRLIGLLDRSGDRAAALAAYDELSARLERQWEVDPSPETQALIERVRDRREQVVVGPKVEVSVTTRSSVASQREAADAHGVAATGVQAEVSRSFSNEGDHREQDRTDSRMRLSRLSVAVVFVLVAVIGWMVAKGQTADPRANPGERMRLVVLQFDHVGDEEDAYLASGVTEEVRVTLSRTQGVLVKGLGYQLPQQEGRPLGELGREWEVDRILYGSVRTEGERLRVTAYLVDAETEEHLWSRAFDGEADDVLGLQGRVARSIARGLGDSLAPVPALESMSPAHVLYQEGVWRYWIALASNDDSERVRAAGSIIAVLQRATAVDASHAPSHAWLSKTFSALASASGSSSDRDSAVAHARTALALAPDDPEVLFAANAAGLWTSSRERAHDVLTNHQDFAPLLNNVAFLTYTKYRSTLDSAVIAAGLAYRAAPPPLRSIARLQGARAFAYLGAFEEAHQWLGAWRALEPPGGSGNEVWVLLTAGRIEEAERRSDELRRRRPQVPMSHFVAGDVALAREDYERAVDHYRRAVDLIEGRAMEREEGSAEAFRADGYAPHSFARGLRTGLAFALARTGGEGEAVALYRAALSSRMEEVSGAPQPVSSSGRLDVDPSVFYDIALIHAQLGDREEAIRWFHRAVDAGFKHYYVALIDPLFDPLRSEPRVQELMASVRADLDRAAARARTWLATEVDLMPAV